MIVFVREYKAGNEKIYDVAYGNDPKKYPNRCVTHVGECPNTVKKFISSSVAREQVDQFHGKEIIYTVRG